MTVYAYCRVSTAEQGASGLGLKAQENALQAWAQMTGADITVVREVASGMGDQPMLAGILESLGADDTLVVAKLDRLTRSRLKFMNVLADSDRRGFRIVLLDMGVDTRTPMGAAMASIMAVMANLERDFISERTKAALAVKSARGELDRPDRRTDPKAVARAVELRHGGATLRQIGQALTDEGYQTAQNGKEWYPGTVRYLLAKAT